METEVVPVNFSTPSPVTVTLGLFVADVHVLAAERSDSLVEVRPSDPGQPADVKAASNTRVDYDDATRTLSVVTRKRRNRFVNFTKRPESIDVVIHVPAGSAVRGKADAGDYRTEGVLGAVDLKTGFGAVQVGEAVSLNIRTGHGEVAVGASSGSAEVHSASGDIRIGAVDGPADISASNGTIRIGVITGAAIVKGANGAVSVDQALSDIAASSSNGAVRIGEVVRGKVAATSKNGRVEIGIRESSAARLELHTTAGHVYNEYASSDSPADGAAYAVDVHASTKLGDITVRRVPGLDEDA